MSISTTRELFIHELSDAMSAEQQILKMLPELQKEALNPELKQALTEYAQGLEKVNNQINGVQDLDKLGDLNTAEIESATDKVLRICG